MMNDSGSSRRVMGDPVQEYLFMRAHCTPDYVSDQSISQFIVSTNVYLSLLERIGSSKDVMATQALAYHSMNTLIRRAPWLEESTRAKAREFMGRQREFIDDRYRFSMDLSQSYLPLWNSILGGLAGHPGLAFLEVGTFEGQSACWLLGHILTHPTSHLVCIDIFDDEPSEQGHLDIGIDSHNMCIYDRLRYNLALTNASDRVTVIKGMSDIELRRLSVNAYDFIYIDGSHIARDVVQDGVLAWGLLKSGGVLAFDDYLWQSPLSTDPLASPKAAIDCVLDLFSGAYTLLSRGEQAIIMKK